MDQAEDVLHGIQSGYAGPPRPVVNWMSDVWRTLSTLGDSRWLLPMALVLLFTLPPTDRALKCRWLIAIALTATVTLASKLAFMGWGVGIKSLHFTGFSGHAAMSSVVYPVVGAILAGPNRAHRRIGLAAGCALAAAIAWSRIPLHAHSLSEIVAGLTLGLGCGAWAMRITPPSGRPRAIVVVAAMVAGVILPLSLPDIHTHQLVIALAKFVSGRVEIFEHF